MATTNPTGSARGTLPAELTSFVGRRRELSETRRLLAEQPDADPDRGRRGRQDPAGAAHGGRGAAYLPRRGVVRRAGRAPRPAAAAAHRGQHPRAAPGLRRPRRPTSRRTWRTSGCWWCSTTASTSPTPARCWRASCWPRLPACASWPPAGTCSGSRASRSSWCRRCRTPTAGGRGRRRHPLRVGAALPGPRRGGGARSSRSRTATGRRWSSCAGGSTASRWPSSSRRCGCAPSRRRRSSTGSRTASGCSPPGDPPRRPGSRRWTPLSAGATTCARRRSGCCGRGCRSSREASTSRPPRRSARRRDPPRRGPQPGRRPGQQVDHHPAAGDRATRPPGTTCWRRIRQYGAERLADGDQVRALRVRHRDHYRSLAERFAAESFGPRQADWFIRLRREPATSGRPWSSACRAGVTAPRRSTSPRPSGTSGSPGSSARATATSSGRSTWPPNRPGPGVRAVGGQLPGHVRGRLRADATDARRVRRRSPSGSTTTCCGPASRSARARPLLYQGDLPGAVACSSRPAGIPGGRRRARRVRHADPAVRGARSSWTTPGPSEFSRQALELAEQHGAQSSKGYALWSVGIVQWRDRRLRRGDRGRCGSRSGCSSRCTT